MHSVFFSAIQIFDFDYALLSGELDIDKFVSLSSDIMLVEMIHRVFVSSYEVGLPVCKYKCVFISCLHVKAKKLAPNYPLNIVCLREFHMHTMELLPP